MGTQKTVRYWWKKLRKIQTDGKKYYVYGLEELILLKWPYYPRQSTDSMQSLSKYQWHFTDLEKMILKFVWTQKNTPNGQNNLKKEEQSWRYHASQFQTIIQRYSNQNSMVLAQKQTHRSVEQKREPTNEPILIQTKEARL